MKNYKKDHRLVKGMQRGNWFGQGNLFNSLWSTIGSLRTSQYFLNPSGINIPSQDCIVGSMQCKITALETCMVKLVRIVIFKALKEHK